MFWRGPANHLNPAARPRAGNGATGQCTIGILNQSGLLQGGLIAVRGGAGQLTVTAIAGHVTANGGAGGITFSEGPPAAATLSPPPP